jgi:hypothetical protein
MTEYNLPEGEEVNPSVVDEEDPLSHVMTGDGKPSARQSILILCPPITETS